jgi:hypothetical protein
MYCTTRFMTLGRSNYLERRRYIGRSVGGKRVTSRIKNGFNLGGEQAEADPLLQEAFYESADYETIVSRSDPKCFLVARTGGGKSAALQTLEDQYPGHVIRINPEDLSLPYITELNVIRYLDSLDVSLDLLFIALWKHVLLVELIRHRYKVDSPVAKQNLLAQMRDKFFRDPTKRAALDYLDEFGEKFWCEAHERVREITEKFAEKINNETKGSVSIPKLGQASIGGASETSYTNERKAEQAERFQRIVNETQLARLNIMLKALDEDMLDRPQHFTYVVIDDLDRDWVDNRLTNDLIRCLFRTVLDLKRVKNLKVLVALRTNIMEQLNFGERSGSQEEKFRSLVLQMKWNRSSLISIVDERLRIAAARSTLGVTSISELLPAKNRTRGDPIAYILDRTLMRPRDVIAFFNEGLSVAAGKPRLSWQDIHSAERAYSEKRLLALRDEWKRNYPDIQRSFDIFRRIKVPMSRDELLKRLDDVMLLPADPKFRGVRWVTNLSTTMMSSGSGTHDWVELYQPLISFFYRLGFIGCARTPHTGFIYFYDDPGYADRASNLEAATLFQVHPTFHAALDAAVKFDQTA